MRHPLKARLSSVKTQMASINAAVTVNASTAKEGEAPGPATFNSVAYSGDVVSRSTLSKPLEHDYIIELSGMTSAKNVKANLDHKTSQRVGHITEYQNDGTKVTLGGVLSAKTPYRDEVADSAALGYSWEGSIEASLSKPRLIPAGKSETVNGRVVSGPLYVFAKSVLTDLAFVSHGADGGNQVTIAASAVKEETMNEFDKYIVKLGLDPETISAETRAALQVSFDAQQGKKPALTGSFTMMAEEIRKDHEREQKIKLMGREACKENPMYIDQIGAMVEAALESKADPDKFELELLRSTRMSAGKFQNSPSGLKGMDKDRAEACYTAAFCMATGLPDIEKHFKEKTLDDVDKSKLRNVSLQQMLIQIAQCNGYHAVAGERIGTHNLRSILSYAMPPEHVRAQMAFSTASLPNILGAVANKQILAGYMEEDTTWKEIATVKSVSNFYTQNYYRMLDSMEYEEVGSGGEIKHGTLGEETYTSAAKTYGKMLGITRTQIINDDLGAFDDIRARLGRGAAKKFGNVFWTAFINNSSFFTSGNTNYISGSTTNLGTDGVGLGLGVKGCRLMTSPTADGTKRVGQGFTPSILLVPPELEQIADNLYRNNNPGFVAGSSVNTFAGKYRPVVQNRLSDSAFTGYSTTAWYLVGSTMKPMLVTFLNGNQTPIVESTDADFDTLGIQFRGYHDFGCDKSEYLAALKSKGAA